MFSKPMNRHLYVHTLHFFVPGTICIFLTGLPVDMGHLNYACVGIMAQFMSVPNFPQKSPPAFL
jgi:hypothetical protein